MPENVVEANMSDDAKELVFRLAEILKDYDTHSSSIALINLLAVTVINSSISLENAMIVPGSIATDLERIIRKNWKLYHWLDGPNHGNA